MKKSIDLQPSTGGWVVLGLLLESPCSGYDLALLAQRTVGQFWPVTKTHVYGELPRLERLGYAASQHVPQEGLPDKRVYAATARGRKAFSHWLNEADLGAPLLRHPFLVHVFFGAHIAAARLQTLIGAQREMAAQARLHFDALLKKADASLGKDLLPSRRRTLDLRRLAVRHAILRLDAEIQWLLEVSSTVGGEKKRSRTKQA